MIIELNDADRVWLIAALDIAADTVLTVGKPGEDNPMFARGIGEFTRIKRELERK